MKNYKMFGLLAAALMILASPLPAEDRGETFRRILGEKATSVVSVRMVLKVHVEFMGQSQDQERSSTG